MIAWPSLLDSVGTVEVDLKEAEAMGMPGIRRLDHPLSGVFDFEIGAFR